MSGSAKHKQYGDFFVFFLEGYVEKNVSQVVLEQFRIQWEQGLRRFIFDFSKVTIINSVALSDLLEIVSEGIGDDDVCFFFCGIPDNCVFGISSVGLLNYVQDFDNLEEAKKELGF